MRQYMGRNFQTEGDSRAFFLEPYLAKEGEADLFASQCLHYLIYNQIWKNLSDSGSDLATALKNISKVEDITNPKFTRGLGDALFHRLSWIVPDFLGQTTTFLNERNIFTSDEITALQKYVFIPPQTRPTLTGLNMYSGTRKSIRRWSQIAGNAERKLLYTPLHHLKIRAIGKDEQPLSEILDQKYHDLIENTLNTNLIADPGLPPPYLWQAREDVAAIAQDDPEVSQALENITVPADKLLLFMQEIIAPIGTKARFLDQDHIKKILLASLTRWKREVVASVPDGMQLLPETVVTEEIFSAAVATDEMIDFSDPDLPTSLKTALLGEGIKSWNFLTGMTLVQLVRYRRLGALAPLILYHGVLKK